MAEVRLFPGETRAEYAPQQILDIAGALDLSMVIVVGTSQEGKEVFLTSVEDGPMAGWMLDRAKLRLLRAVD